MVVKACGVSIRVVVKACGVSIRVVLKACGVSIKVVVKACGVSIRVVVKACGVSIRVVVKACGVSIGVVVKACGVSIGVVVKACGVSIGVVVEALIIPNVSPQLEKVHHLQYLNASGCQCNMKGCATKMMHDVINTFLQDLHVFPRQCHSNMTHHGGLSVFLLSHFCMTQHQAIFCGLRLFS